MKLMKLLGRLVDVIVDSMAAAPSYDTILCSCLFSRRITRPPKCSVGVRGCCDHKAKWYAFAVSSSVVVVVVAAAVVVVVVVVVVAFVGCVVDYLFQFVVTHAQLASASIYWRGGSPLSPIIPSSSLKLFRRCFQVKTLNFVAFGIVSVYLHLEFKRRTAHRLARSMQSSQPAFPPISSSSSSSLQPKTLSPVAQQQPALKSHVESSLALVLAMLTTQLSHSPSLLPYINDLFAAFLACLRTCGAKQAVVVPTVAGTRTRGVENSNFNFEILTLIYVFLLLLIHFF
jgi:hypothetical protein